MKNSKGQKYLVEKEKNH